MQTRIWLATLCLVAGGAVHAAGNPAAGKAASMVCASCHGMDGASAIDPTYPNLAGQSESYLLRQLEAIQSDARPILLMTGQLTGKSPADLADLAAYYASLPSKLGTALGDDAAIATAEQLYRGGSMARNVPACIACHAPGGGGNSLAGFPAISGQPAAYLAAQLTAYREGLRTTDEIHGRMMRDAARNLTDGDIRALADYIQGLGPANMSP